MIKTLVASILQYVLVFIWKKAEEAIKDKLVQEQVEKRVREALDDYEKIIMEAQELAKNGLTEEEKNAIRKKKIELEKRIFNSFT